MSFSYSILIGFLSIICQTDIIFYTILLYPFRWVLFHEEAQSHVAYCSSYRNRSCACDSRVRNKNRDYNLCRSDEGGRRRLDHKLIDVTLESSGLRIQSPDTICSRAYYTFYTNYVGSKSEVVFQASNGWSIQKIEFGCQQSVYLPSAKEGVVKITSDTENQAVGMWTAPSEAGLRSVTFTSSTAYFSFLSNIDRIHNVVVTLVRD